MRNLTFGIFQFMSAWPCKAAGDFYHDVLHNFSKHLYCAGVAACQAEEGHPSYPQRDANVTAAHARLLLVVALVK